MHARRTVSFSTLRASGVDFPRLLLRQGAPDLLSSSHVLADMVYDANVLVRVVVNIPILDLFH
jgi:hypothetical protein